MYVWGGRCLKMAAKMASLVPEDVKSATSYTSSSAVFPGRAGGGGDLPTSGTGTTS